MWSYHWWFGYLFVTLPFQEWMHCNPWYTPKYCCNYRFGKWNSHTKKGFPPFPPPYIDKWILSSLKVDIVIANPTHIDLVQCALRMTTHVTIVAIQNKAQSYIERTFGDNFIPLAINLWLFPSSFWFLFDFLCACHYSLPSTCLLGTFDAYILL